MIFLEVNIMSKVVEFLNANPVQYLATVGRDGKAKCRPFMFSGEMDGKLWFCTNSTKSSITAKPRLVSTQNLLANRSCPIMRYCPKNEEGKR